MGCSGNGMSVRAFILCAGFLEKNETADATGDSDRSGWKNNARALYSRSLHNFGIKSAA